MIRPARVLCASGPNLRLLGSREPDVYGAVTLETIHARLAALATALGVSVTTQQSNHEGDLVTWVGEAGLDGFDGVLLNPGALTHTSYALYDAVRACARPTVEIHISNPDAREPFRRRSRIAPACLGRIAGFGGCSYELGLLALVHHLRDPGATLSHVGLTA